ncbi:DUF2059 domain-containing protein [Asticcacaulis sp. DW145]|uniref:DUF2059 domain-containing protein n=1 Tax=Asticcacaulis sp. DW145 TaxID=3095608 RepID=UPI0030866A6A|nr:DUF2059 domain-containing protein [Asticcacaulis sp. DW145]
MRRFLIAVTLFFTATGLAPSVMAQEAATPEKIALVKRYYALVKLDKMFEQMFDRMGPAMIEQIKARDPNVSEEQTRLFLKVSGEATTQYLNKMMDRSATVYAEVYTLDELKYMVSFYEDPRGKAMIEKMPLVMEKASQIAVSLMPEFQDDLMKRMCEVTGCKAPKATKPKA